MHNVISSRTFRRFGFSATLIQNAQKCCLSKLNHGIYVAITRCPRHPELEMFLDDEEVLALRARDEASFSRADRETIRRSEVIATICAYQRYIDGDVLGLTSAAVIHGIPLIGASMTTGPRSRSRNGRGQPPSHLALGDPGTPVHIDVWNPIRPYRSPWITRRRAHVDPEEVTQSQGLAVTSIARTSVDLARAGTAFDGAVAMDFVLADAQRSGGRDAFDRMREALLFSVDNADRTPGVVRARTALATATGLSESVAESLALQWFHILGIWDIRQQVDLHDEAHGLVARVDFLLTATDGALVVVEVDGAVKYVESQWAPGYAGVGGGSGSRVRQPGVRNPLFREKRREDRIRRLGYRVVRLTWADLMSPKRMSLLLREAGVRCE